MNRPTSHSRTPPIDPQRIDRLVDGELNDPERRALLKQLDAEPNSEGWKRCALAFLEAQAWREAFKPLSKAEPFEPTPQQTPRPRLLVLSAKLAMAAGFVLLAFAAGWITGEARTGLGQGEVVQVAGEPKGPDVEPEVGGPPDSSPKPVPNDAWPEVRMVGFVQLPGQGGALQAPWEVPVLAGPGLDESWLRLQPSIVPEEFRARWEDQGYRVEQRRRLVSMELDDGQYLALPVDEVDLHYIGPSTF